LLPALEAIGGRGASSSSGSASTAAGFTVLDTSPRAPTFDVPLTVKVGSLVEARFERRVVEYVKEQLLREKDINRNGLLERSEWTGRWRPPAEEADRNGDGVLDMEELCLYAMDRLSSRDEERSSRGRSRGDDNDRDRSSDRSSSTSSNSSGSRGFFGGGPPGGSEDNSDRFKMFADSMMRRYDANGNGKLERDEWTNLRNAEEMDTNKDGVITSEELVARFQSFTASRTSPQGDTNSDSDRRGGRRGGFGDRGGSSDRGGPGGFGGPGGAEGFSGRPGGFGGRGGFGERGSGERGGSEGGERERSASVASSQKTSYRVLTAAERLPENIDSTFIRWDANGDGQVSMAEYSSNWNDKVAADFMKLDLNGDGFITADEYLSTAPSSYSSSSRSSSSNGTSRRGDESRRGFSGGYGGSGW
jgi:hypothetical protein